MIIPGSWILQQQPLFQARVAFPSINRSFPIYLRFNPDLPHTVLRESPFPREVTEMALRAAPMPTAFGMLPVKVINRCELIFKDVHQRPVRLDLPLRLAAPYGTRAEQLSPKHTLAATGSADPFGLHWHVLGADILNRLVMVARCPNLLLLTDEAVEWTEFARQRLAAVPA